MIVVLKVFANITYQKANEVNMKHSRGRKIYIALSSISVATVAIIIFFLSAQTATESNGTSDSLINLIFSFFGKSPNENLIRTLAHFCEFAGFGFLVANLIFSINNTKKTVLSTLLSFAYAITDEIHQIFVPGRAFQLIDLTVDLSGIIFGVVVFGILIMMKDRAQNSKCKV